MYLYKDYEGQKLAEKLYQWIIILFAVSFAFLSEHINGGTDEKNAMETSSFLGGGLCLGIYLPAICTDNLHTRSWGRSGVCGELDHSIESVSL